MSNIVKKRSAKSSPPSGERASPRRTPRARRETFGLARAPAELRSVRKRRDILDVACSQFLKRGYAGTSIDSIVEIVGGSKATIYGYFGSKQNLLAEVINAVTHDGKKPAVPSLGGDVRAELLAFAIDRLEHVLSPLHIGIQQLVIAEAQRLPGIARIYFDRGPAPSFRALADYLRDAVRGGRLTIADVDQATDAFFGELLFHDLLGRLFGATSELGADKLETKAREVVDGFLRTHAYRDPGL